jgi:hypothetical protein
LPLWKYDAPVELPHFIKSGDPHISGKLLVSQKQSHRGGHRCIVVLSNKESLTPRFKQVWESSDIRAHNTQTGGHCFQHAHRRVIYTAGVQKNIRALKYAGDFLFRQQ